MLLQHTLNEITKASGTQNLTNGRKTLGTKVENELKDCFYIKN